ncbi:prolipoprotein diacylglyceryl transferase [Sporolactobacillus sp. CQH2019]|uniref:prolipoprotein diacylglyceryl transferase n=1 Tax=Sporolactobacillus sp. CQH2019 TaxID=3023512 RepID=UPI0023684909|nr:prolipoprotein diacylglyceryl transferase [Sporolactobacillus sp. CQH2019]MDD9150251.1 prolipoprotein diacylglyceryl transferase [Sporolactobacillus sp. CQH2019]
MNLSIQPLNRVAVRLGPIHIYWYGIIIACGALLGLLLAMKEGRKRGLPKDLFVDLILFAAPIAILCARIYYVAFEWNYYSGHPSEIIAVWDGGIAIHGALIGAVATALVFCKVRRVPFWKVADIAAPSVLLGQAIGRWGNFMNQEAHGGPTTRLFLENLHLPNFIINQMYINGTYYVPTFLYESVWDFLGFILLIILRRANLGRGELFLTYLIWYSVGRFYIEGLRTDSLMLTGSLRIAQVVSILLIILCIILIVYRRIRNDAKVRYFD